MKISFFTVRPVKHTNSFVILLLMSVFLMTCGKKGGEEEMTNDAKDPLAMTYSIRTTWAHDPSAFIQGLEIHNGQLYESTGQNGTSWIGILDINQGKLDKKVTLDKQHFGEGITILNNKVYQLTWTSKIGFIYDLKTFKRLGEFTYETPGWGLTHDSTNIIMSDGSEHLYFLDTLTLKPARTLTVTDNAGPVKNLNELEYVNGFVFANIWETDRIVKIDPKSGKVVGRLDLSAISRDAKMRSDKSEVLNGIAYHPGTKLFIVTGKNWPVLYVLNVK